MVAPERPVASRVIPEGVRRVPPPRVPETDFERMLERELNADQRAAVLAPLQSQICVTSGPGSGKTRILTYRLVYLVQQLREEPGSLLAVTFTVKGERRRERERERERGEKRRQKS